MGISFTDFTGGSSRLNNFALSVGTSGNTTFVLDRTYDSGSYAITFANGDTTYDIYAISTSGAVAGYSSGTAISITNDFNRLVIIGAANNEQIFFEYRGEISTPTLSGDIDTAGAYIVSAVTSSLPNTDDTTTIVGGNFANDVEVYFIGQDLSETLAKNIVRSSSTQLIVTRPDSFAVSNSPYSIKVVNPGVQVPSGSGSHILSNSITAGTLPSWETDSAIYWSKNFTNSISLVATDTELSDIDYSVVGGSLPIEFSLDQENGIIDLISEATDQSSFVEGLASTFTVRATDAGNNYVDKEFSLYYNDPPTWITASGLLQTITVGASASITLAASNGSVGTTLSYSVQSGTLPTGLSLNASTGEISGTMPDEEQTFTIRVTDNLGAYADREFSISSATAPGYILLATYTMPSAGSLTISNIDTLASQEGVSHLEIRGSFKSGSGDDWVQCNLSGSFTGMLASGGAGYGQSYGRFFYIQDTQNLTNYWAPLILKLHKPFIAGTKKMMQHGAAAHSIPSNRNWYGYNPYSSTPTSITFSSNKGSLSAGTKVSIYGVRA